MLRARDSLAESAQVHLAGAEVGDFVGSRGLPDFLPHGAGGRQASEKEDGRRESLHVDSLMLVVLGVLYG